MKAISKWLFMNYWIPWAILVGILFFSVLIVCQLALLTNVHFLPEVPWGACIVFLIICIFYRFSTGVSWPFRASLTRNKLAGCYTLKGKKTLWILVGGAAQFLFVFSTLALGFGLSNSDTTSQLQFIEQFEPLPIHTAMPTLFAAALTAGVVEEIVFRGYLQGAIQNRFGVFPSIAFVAIVFTLLHLLPMRLMLPYALVSISFSILTYYSESVIPGIVTHTVFNFSAFLLLHNKVALLNPENLRQSAWLYAAVAIGSTIAFLAVRNKIRSSKAVT